MTPATPPPPRRATAQQLALAHVRELIATGHLEPDERIRQEQLAAQLGCSVVPVREALKTLEAEGLVRYEPHRGYQVARLSLGELRETYLIRRLLEDEVVRIAAPLLSEDDFAGLDHAMDQMEAASERGDAAAMTEWNRRLHFAIYAAAGHPRMVDFIRMLWQSTDAYRSMYYSDAAARERVNAEHRSIVEALRAGDVDRAVAELDRHRGHAVDSLQDRLTEPSGHP
jgi:DNA-binding GntR family transcriptional regulator